MNYLKFVFLMLLGLMVAGCTAVSAQTTPITETTEATAVPTPSAPLETQPPPTAAPEMQATAVPQTQSILWQRTNPGGGGAFATVGAGPTGIILAASDLSGAYRSLDRGHSWDIIGAADGLTATHVSGIGFDPLDGSVLFLGTDEGIFRSGDGGETVSQVLDSGYVTDIEIAPSDTQVGYAAYHPEWDSNDGRIYKTFDNGRSWQPISANLPAGLRILELAIHPADADAVYLLAGEGRFACSEAAVYRSLDGGVNWSQLAADKGQIMDLAMDAAHPETLYIASYGDVWDEGYDCIVDDPDGGKLYRSDDGGDSWTELTARTGIIWLDADDDHAIRLIDVHHQFSWDSDNGVWESPDGVNDWTQVSLVENWDTGWTEAYFAYGGSFNGDAKTLGEDMSDPDALLWATGQWIFGTFDDGRFFQNLFTDEIAPGQWQSRGLDNVDVFDIVVSPADPDDVYVGFFDLGCFHSGDSGASWQNCNHPDYTGGWEGEGGDSFAIAADPARAGVVWMSQAGSPDGTHTLLRSSDAGANWVLANAGLPAAPTAGLTVDPASPENNRALFVTAGGDVYRSVDDGLSWTLVFACGGCHFTAVSPTYIYAGGEAGLWRAARDGSSWVEVGLPEMRGGQGGEFWTRYWEGVSAVTVDPSHPDWVYVAAFGPGKGLYRSQDSGESWEKLWTDDFMRDTAVSPADPNLIYAASSSAMSDGGYDSASHGVLRSDDGGQTWQPVNDGLDWPFAVTVTFNLADPAAVFIGSPGPGIYSGRQLSASQLFLPVMLTPPG